MAKSQAYIEARLRDLFAAMRVAAPQEPEAHAAFEEVIRVIAAIFHYERHALQQQLKDLYDPLDPDRAPPSTAPGASAAAFAAFEQALETILIAANFEETPFDAMGKSQKAKLLNDLTVKASDTGVRRIRFFARGSHPETVERKIWFGLRKEDVEVEVLEEVVLLVAFQDESEVEPKARKKLNDMRRGIRPGAALVKLFTNVQRHELVALHPGAKPTMRTRDQVFLGVPAVASAVPIAMQIGPAITVLFAVIASFFAAGAIIDNSELKRALAAISGVVAVGTFVMRQWMKYERQTLRYQKRLADTIYYRNLANNEGVIGALIGAAEEQDVKEAALAYWALLAEGRALTKEEIDKAAETLLRERLKREVDFEIADALNKLERLGIVARAGEKFAPLSPETALQKLDNAWDDIFKYAAQAK